MDIVSLVIILAAIGVILWAADRYLPIAQPFKGIAFFLIVLLGVILVLNFAGILPHRVIVR